jgi:TRAP-type C4-dicarboxylate transport system permease small subunit
MIAKPIFFLADISGWISSASLLALATLVIVDVVGRAFNAPLSSGSDIGAMLMVALIFFAIAGTQVDKDHVSMDALVASFPTNLQRITDRMSLVVCAAVGGYLGYGTVLAAIKSFHRGEMALGALQLPLWPAKSMIAFGICLYTLVVVAQLLGANPSGKTQDSIPPQGAE